MKSKINRLSIKTFCFIFTFSTGFFSIKLYASFSVLVKFSVYRWFNVYPYNYSFNLVSDIDECSSNSHSCDMNAVCNNTRGLYTCACKPGYSGDGKNCTGKLYPHNKHYKVY